MIPNRAFVHNLVSKEADVLMRIWSITLPSVVWGSD